MEYLDLSRAELNAIWQREVGSLDAPTARTERAGASGGVCATDRTPRLALSGGAEDSGGEADVELALTSVVSLAHTRDGVVRRIIM